MNDTPAYTPRRIPALVTDVVIVAIVLLGTGMGIAVWVRTMKPDPSLIGFIVGLGLLQSIPLLYRRAHPVLALACASLALLAYEPLASPVTPYGVLLALYAVAVYAPRRASLLVIGAAVPTLLAFLAVRALFFTDRINLRDVATFALALLATWAIGNGIGIRRAYVHAVEERARLLERRRVEEAAWAVQTERARIAREMHDIVAHHVSMMVIQAGAARRVLDSDPAATREAIGLVETSGRKAMDELRRLVSVLRSDGETDARQPLPGIEQIDDLITQMRSAGMDVALDREGEPFDVPEPASLAVYRIVQEALTNVVKHAGSAHVTVHLLYEQDAVSIQVDDDGAGRIDSMGDGHGILGMRERTAMFGGDLHAGPRVGGGFTVRARIPVGQGALR